MKTILASLLLAVSAFSHASEQVKEGSPPRDTGKFTVAISKIDTVTVTPKKITLAGFGHPVLDKFPLSEEWSKASLEIVIWKEVWQETHNSSWDAYVRKLKETKRFSGRFTALNAFWVTYGGGEVFWVSCCDLISEEK